MNSTNRALNRIGTFIVGLVLFAVGGAAALAAAIPDWMEPWTSASSNVDDTVTNVFDTTKIASLDQTWLFIAIPVLCVVLIVLLLVFAFRQGHGRSAILVDDSSARSSTRSVDGSVIVDSKVAEQAIQHALDEHPGLVSSDVTTYTVKRTPVMRITTNVRRGVSPNAIRTFVDETVDAWDGVLGREVPVLIQINAGLTTRVAKATRVAPGVDA